LPAGIAADVRRRFFAPTWNRRGELCGSLPPCTTCCGWALLRRRINGHQRPERWQICKSLSAKAFRLTFPVFIARTTPTNDRLRSRSDSIMSLNSLRADHASSACNCSNSTPRLRAILSRTASDGFLIPRSISESPGAEMLIRRESSRPEIPFPFRVCRMKAPRFVVGILLIAVRTLQEWISNMTISHIAPSNLRNCLNDLVCSLSGFCCNRKFVKSDCKMP
jgi:hypothetical protein